MVDSELDSRAYGRLIKAAIPTSVSAPETHLTQRRTIDLKRHAAARCCG